MTRVRAERAVTAVAALALLTAAPASAQNQRGVTHACDRACLTRVVDTYVAGLLANDPSRLPLAPNAKLTLNDDVVPRGQAVLGSGGVRPGPHRHRQPAPGRHGHTDGDHQCGRFTVHLRLPAEGEGQPDRGSRGDADPQRRRGRPVRPEDAAEAEPEFHDAHPAGRAGFLLRPHRRRGRVLARVQHQRHARIPSGRVLAARAAPGERLQDDRRRAAGHAADERGGAVRWRLPCGPQYLGPAVPGRGRGIRRRDERRALRAEDGRETESPGAGRGASGGRVLRRPQGRDLRHPGGDGEPRREAALGVGAGLRAHARRVGAHRLQPRLPHRLRRRVLPGACRQRSCARCLRQRRRALR